MIEATADLDIRIKDHLHLVVIMTPATFDETYPMYSNLFNKSGLVRMSSWPEETLIAIGKLNFKS